MTLGGFPWRARQHEHTPTRIFSASYGLSEKVASLAAPGLEIAVTELLVFPRRS
jgi:hypothetical protein